MLWPRLSHFTSTRATRHARKISSAPSAKDKFKILFLGREEFSCIVLKELFAAEDVWASLDIATNPDENIGRRGSKLSISPLKTLGESLEIPVHLIPREKIDFRHWTPPAPFSESVSPNNLVVTASFGRILSSHFLDLFAPTRRLNVHPSLLPKYRGPAPIQHAILSGDSATGVSIISMLKRKEGIDAGDVWGSKKMAVASNATYLDLQNSLALQGGKLLVSVLRDMISGTAKASPQVGEVSHAPLITYDDSIVDFTTMSAESIVRRYRAIGHQRPITVYALDGCTIQLGSPSVESQPPSFVRDEPGVSCLYRSKRSVLVRCVDGSVLSIPNMKPEASHWGTGKDWWNGVKGMNFVKNGTYRFINKRYLEP
ncbi:Formyltransferase [Guyanagaster necrorhizus]|uniref:methionyl-tRNA formyltransferase n=1 Tax=Guyanagaster necrorhizus TaxID=856835 RepID=A0A9P7VYW7_9AGAR|nr:Formyltransferase [Guyanagaster necrorhizus MCA 3950]KAG7448799.1 Formyltransferase [Guyanagaster necrorhizus MCA 3950]